MASARYLALSFIIMGLFGKLCQAEIYSSVAEIEKLISSSLQIPQLIEKYFELERQRLESLKEYAPLVPESIASGHTHLFLKIYEQNAQFFTIEALRNPTSAYLIIKLLEAYWSPIEGLMRQNQAEALLNEAKTGTVAVPRVTLPSTDDVIGLAKALLVLQTTYELETKDLADGKLPMHASRIVMTAKDCYDIGRVAYDTRWLYHTILWMQEALERAELEKPGPTVTEAAILEYLAYPVGELGDVRRALEITKRLHELVPDHPRAPGNIAYYEYILSQNDTRADKPKAWNETSAKWVKYGMTTLQQEATYDHYAALCRGDIRQPDTDIAKLHCYYKTDMPFLKLAPIKVEFLTLQPPIRLFHQVISDREIESITQLAFPKLFRSMVVDRHGNGSELSESRVSKNTWLHDLEHPIVETVSRRVSDMTNLAMETSEQYQVANYGIGGHYQPHVDTLLVDANGEPDLEKMVNTPGATTNGDRIATVLFYLSQPEAGGATVFPELNVTLFPSKNNAVFWLNYKKNGKADMTLRHSGCPVLLGSKWILNKWIHERGQEFRRPCSINENEDGLW